MDAHELIKLINDYPVILTILLMAIGGLITAIPFAFKLGASRERHKIDTVKLASAENAVIAKQEAYEKERRRADLLESEITRIKEVQVFGHWLYLSSDPATRRPICPVCHREGKTQRMEQGCTDSQGKKENFFRCPVHTVKKWHILPNEADELFERLGGKDCYDPSPARSRAPDQARIDTSSRFRPY